jgi:hypothetical protein
MVTNIDSLFGTIELDDAVVDKTRKKDRGAYRKIAIRVDCGNRERKWLPSQ